MRPWRAELENTAARIEHHRRLSDKIGAEVATKPIHHRLMRSVSPYGHVLTDKAGPYPEPVYTSLSYLQLFKFDKFKIDKSFIRTLGETEDALTLRHTIVNLGHNLGLHVTAEGVETLERLAILQALSCEQIQGYLVVKPAPIGSFTKLDRLRVMSMFGRGRLRLAA